MTYRIFIILCLMAMGFQARCQKTYRVKGEASVRVDDHLSKEEARDKARELAVINAIENEFGTYIAQDANIHMEDGKTSFHIIGNTKVRGEWVKTISLDYKEEARIVKNEYGKAYELWLHCKVSGKARDLPSNRPAFVSWPLNCPEENCKTANYYDKQPFYLYFKTPAQGYLTVYLQEDDEVFRLLPYQEMGGNYQHAVPVSADQSYIFFANEPAYDYYKDFDRYLIDELVMTYEGTNDFVTLFVVFSTQEFHKPVLDNDQYEENEYGVPKSLSPDVFMNWLDDNRMKNPQFMVQKIELRISEKP